MRKTILVRITYRLYLKLMYLANPLNCWTLTFRRFFYLSFYWQRGFSAVLLLKKEILGYAVNTLFYKKISFIDHMCFEQIHLAMHHPLVWIRIRFVGLILSSLRNGSSVIDVFQKNNQWAYVISLMFACQEFVTPFFLV